MARREIVEEPEHLERWLVSYADFITLLMAFFVVMYSISSVNDGKYRILSDTLSEAFRTPERSLDPIQVGDMARAFDQNDSSIIELASGGGTSTEGNLAGPTEQLQEIQSSMEELFRDLIQDDLISVNGNELWVEIEMKSGLLFSSGSAIPSADAEIILDEVANIVRDYPNPVHVEGFTDNVPIRTEAFPSNWELSAARSAAIVRLMSDGGVAPERMAAVGYGEFQPVASNDDENGRSQNRRVVLVISRNLNIRRAITAVSSDQAEGAQGELLELNAKVGESPVARGLPREEPAPAETTQPETAQPEAPAERRRPAPVGEPVRPVRLPGGGLLFTREPPATTAPAPEAPAEQ